MIAPELTPIGFAEQILGMSLYAWQDKALAPLELATGPNAKRVNIAVATPNGAGKDDRIIAAAVHYWLGVHARGKVVITTKSDMQLTQQTIPAIERHAGKFEGYSSVSSPRYELSTKTGGKCIGFVTNKAARVEGWHKGDDIDEPLLIIVNEAKSVDPYIFEGLDRCTPNAVMFLSSPGLMMGRFFDCFTKNAADWIKIQVGLADCPHIPQSRIDHVLATYGPEHPFTKSTLYGEFMEQDDLEQFVVPLSSLNACLQSPPRHAMGVKAGFCDFAAGTAEHVFALRDGNKITIPAAWRDANKKAACFRFVSEFRKSGLQEDQIFCDASDKEMWELLRDNGWTIHRKNFGEPAMQKEVYQSWGAEAWHEAGLSILRGEVILPDDDILKAQLTTRKKTITVRGKLGVEEKYEMAKRNLPSPDRADAVVGALAVFDNAVLTKQPFSISPNWREEYGGEGSAAQLEEMGAFAGN